MLAILLVSDFQTAITNAGLNRLFAYWHPLLERNQITMETIRQIALLIFSLFSRQNLKKLIHGETSLTEEEADKIEKFLQRRNQELKQDKINPPEYETVLVRQVAQKKIPYINELSYTELAFLLEKNVSFDRILDVIHAKGGVAKGLASISWNTDKRGYQSHRYSTATVSGMMFGFLLALSFYFLYLTFSGLSYKIAGIDIFPLCALLSLLFCMPLLFRSTNASLKRIQQAKPDIFVPKKQK